MLKPYCLGKTCLRQRSSLSSLVRPFNVHVARPSDVALYSHRRSVSFPYVLCRSDMNELSGSVPYWSWNIVPVKDFRQFISRSFISQSSTTRFDTHKLVKKLQENGFTLEQSECVTTALSEVLELSLGNVTMDTVSKLDQERLEMRIKGSFDEIKNEMFLLENSKFAAVQDKNEKLRVEVTSLQAMLRDEVSKLKGGVALDFSLEKSRVKEEIAERDQKIKDTNNRIETEVAKLGTQLEAQKLDLIKYLAGSILSCFTLFLAVWRFMKM